MGENPQGDTMHQHQSADEAIDITLVEDIAALEPRAKIHAKTIVLVGSICFIYFAQLFNVVGSGAFAGDITAVVGGAEDSIWFTSIITIVTVVLSPPVSQAADYWGRKWLLVILTSCGTIGTIIIARTKSPGMTLAGYGVSSLSFGVQCLLFAVVSEVLPRKHRVTVQAVINMFGCLGGIVGLLVGGSLTRNGNHAGFRTYFYIDAAIYAVAAVGCALLYSPPPRELQVSLTFTQKLGKLDWIGYFLLDAGLTLFCMGLSWSQNPYPWTDAHVLVPFLIGICLIIALGTYEWRFTSVGVFHHSLFKHRNFSIACSCLFVEGLVFFSVNNYLPLEIAVLYTQDSLRLTLHLTITFWALFVFAALAGTFSWKVKMIRLPAIISFCSFIIFFVLMATINSKTPVANVWAYPIFVGLSLGLCLTALITAAQLSTPPDLIATTTGLTVTIRNVGGALGLAIFNAVLNGGLTKNIGPKIAAKVLPLGFSPASLGDLIAAVASGSEAALVAVPGTTREIILAAAAGLKDAYAVSLRYVWVAAGGFAVCALIGSCFLHEMGSHFNEQIDAPAEVDPTIPGDKSPI